MPDPIDWGTALPYFLAAFFGGYLLGSIPFGLILTKLAGHGDIRSIGSGNIGATNVLRTGNKLIAVGTLLGDALKGVVAVLIASNWGPDVTVLAAAGAFFGHVFPVWLRFNGGKGVATFTGLVLVLYWPAGLAFCLTWIATAAAFRMSSLAALVGAALTPVYMYYFNRVQLSELCIFLAVLIFMRHKDNIIRLVRGEEPKIGSK